MRRSRARSPVIYPSRSDVESSSTSQF
jgi:hypothetical protein